MVRSAAAVRVAAVRVQTVVAAVRAPRLGCERWRIGLVPEREIHYRARCFG